MFASIKPFLLTRNRREKKRERRKKKNGGCSSKDRTKPNYVHRYIYIYQLLWPRQKIMAFNKKKACYAFCFELLPSVEADEAFFFFKDCKPTLSFIELIISS